jgi:hypothetical protein
MYTVDMPLNLLRNVSHPTDLYQEAGSVLCGFPEVTPACTGEPSLTGSAARRAQHSSARQ